MISAELLKQVEDYVKANYIDLEALQKKGVKFSIGRTSPPEESLITQVIKSLKENLS